MASKEYSPSRPCQADRRKIFAAYQDLPIDLYLYVLGYEPVDVDLYEMIYDPIEKIDPNPLYIRLDQLGNLTSKKSGKSWWVVDLACAYFGVDRREVLTHPEKYKLHHLVDLYYGLPPRP